MQLLYWKNVNNLRITHTNSNNNNKCSCNKSKVKALDTFTIERYLL